MRLFITERINYNSLFRFYGMKSVQSGNEWLIEYYLSEKRKKTWAKKNKYSRGGGSIYQMGVSGWILANPLRFSSSSARRVKCCCISSSRF